MKCTIKIIVDGVNKVFKIVAIKNGNGFEKIRRGAPY